MNIFPTPVALLHQFSMYALSQWPVRSFEWSWPPVMSLLACWETLLGFAALFLGQLSVITNWFLHQQSWGYFVKLLLNYYYCQVVCQWQVVTTDSCPRNRARKHFPAIFNHWPPTSCGRPFVAHRCGIDALVCCVRSGAQSTLHKQGPLHSQQHQWMFSVHLTSKRMIAAPTFSICILGKVDPGPTFGTSHGTMDLHLYTYSAFTSMYLARNSDWGK